MERQNVCIRRSSLSLDLSLEDMAFLFGNLIPPFEHGIHLYKTATGGNLFVLNEWATQEPSRYKTI